MIYYSVFINLEFILLLFRYRYTLSDLPKILADLKRRADSFDNWEKDVQSVLGKKSGNKIGIYVKLL